MSEQIVPRGSTPIPVESTTERQDESNTSTSSANVPITPISILSTPNTSLPHTPASPSANFGATTVVTRIESTSHPCLSQNARTFSERGYPKHRPKIYRCVSKEIDRSFVLKWEEDLSKRLNEEIGRLEGLFWTSMLCLARKPQEKEHTPTLIILCNSEKHAEEIQSRLGHLRWSRRLSYFRRAAKAGIRVSILPDSTAGLKGPRRFRETRSIQSPRYIGIGLEVEMSTVQRPLSSSSVRLKTHPSAHATFGGLIQIGDQLYGLTVAHPFADHVRDEFEVIQIDNPQKDSGSELDEVKPDDSDTETLEELSILNRCGVLEDMVCSYPPIVEDHRSSSPEISDYPSAKMTVHDIGTESAMGETYEYLGYITALGWQDRRYCVLKNRCTSFNLDGLTSGLSATDWALIELSDHFVWNVLFQDGNRLHAHQSSAIFFGSCLDYAEKNDKLTHKYRQQSSEQPGSTTGVHWPHITQNITAGMANFRGSTSGYHTGVLGALSAYTGFDGFTYNTLQLELSDSIRKGDSGSWVLCPVPSQGLCDERSDPVKLSNVEAVGVVMSGANVISSAYVLPLQEILQDINFSLQVSAIPPSCSDIIRIGSMMQRLKPHNQPSYDTIAQDCTDRPSSPNIQVIFGTNSNVIWPVIPDHMLPLRTKTSEEAGYAGPPGLPLSSRFSDQLPSSESQDLIYNAHR